MIKIVLLILVSAPLFICAQKYEGFIDDKLISFEVKNNQLDGIYTSYIKTFDYKGEFYTGHLLLEVFLKVKGSGNGNYTTKKEP